MILLPIVKRENPNKKKWGTCIQILERQNGDLGFSEKEGQRSKYKTIIPKCQLSRL
jgi:hypothetical protein